jgi:hypothetical protein
MLWPPAAAMAMASLAKSWPLMSAMSKGQLSGSSGGSGGCPAVSDTRTVVPARSAPVIPTDPTLCPRTRHTPHWREGGTSARFRNAVGSGWHGPRTRDPNERMRRHIHKDPAPGAGLPTDKEAHPQGPRPGGGATNG